VAEKHTKEKNGARKLNTTPTRQIPRKGNGQRAILTNGGREASEGKQSQETLQCNECQELALGGEQGSGGKNVAPRKKENGGTKE